MVCSAREVGRSGIVLVVTSKVYKWLGNLLESVYMLNMIIVENDLHKKKNWSKLSVKSYQKLDDHTMIVWNHAQFCDHGQKIER